MDTETARNSVPKLANGDHVQGLMDNQDRGSSGMPRRGTNEPFGTGRACVYSSSGAGCPPAFPTPRGYAVQIQQECLMYPESGWIGTDMPMSPMSVSLPRDIGDIGPARAIGADVAPPMSPRPNDIMASATLAPGPLRRWGRCRRCRGSLPIELHIHFQNKTLHKVIPG
jgi:hypothetical protein